jgi:hypothetical protein
MRISSCRQANYSRAIPELVLGSLSIIGAALCLLLPETLYRTLPVTLEDGEAFGEGEGIWEFAWCQKPDKKRPQHNSTLDLVSWPKLLLQQPWHQEPQTHRCELCYRTFSFRCNHYLTGMTARKCPHTTPAVSSINTTLCAGFRLLIMLKWIISA